jgi:hypothetical protein
MIMQLIFSSSLGISKGHWIYLGHLKRVVYDFVDRFAKISDIRVFYDG